MIYISIGASACPAMDRTWCKRRTSVVAFQMDGPDAFNPSAVALDLALRPGPWQVVI